jgi:hypothetical protein
MRVLLTNWRLVSRAGPELYVFDLARWLRAHGHDPIVYSARLGALADEMRKQGIVVVDDLQQVAVSPDVIHAQHHLPTMTALAQLPGVPAVAFVHGSIPWEETPVRHPQIRRYVCVSDDLRERLVTDFAIDAGIVSVIPDFVDVERFALRTAVAKTPRKALLFDNAARKSAPWVEAIRSACVRHGLSLDIVGRDSGTAVSAPEDVLPEFDIVFAKGRSAIEALSSGAAVVVCGMTGVAGLVTPENFDEYRAGNFDLAVMQPRHSAQLLDDAISGYDAQQIEHVARTARDTLALDAIVPRIVNTYERAIGDAQAQPVEQRESTGALVAYMTGLNKADLLTFERAAESSQVANAERARLVREVQTMRTSTSWRVTSPLRALGQVVRTLRG